MRKILFYLYIFIQVCISAQTPFEIIRKNITSSNHQNSLSIIDSCLKVKYQIDSSMYYKGLVYIKNNNIKLATKLCNTLHKKFPNFYEVHYLKGLISFSKNNFLKSITEFSKIIKINPNDPKALYNRSIAYGKLEDYDDAIEDLNSCIKLNPNYEMAHYSRAYWLEYTQKYKEAIEDYEFVIRIDPNNFEAYFGLAYLYTILKEKDKACNVINKAILMGSQIATELKDSFCQ